MDIRTCFFPPDILYANPPFRGVKIATALDSTSIQIEWFKAYTKRLDFSISYKVYFSSIEEDVFSEGPKFLAPANALSTVIQKLRPGDLYYFAVRAALFPNNYVNLNNLPNFEDTTLKVIPETLLSTTINESQLTIPVIDATDFPNYGILELGTEYILYSGVDYSNNVINAVQRGFYNTFPTQHSPDGYDGYTYQDPVVYFFKGFEELNENIMMETANSEFPIYNYTEADGYAQLNQIVYSDYTDSDEDYKDFPAYDYGSYHRDHPADIWDGKCLGTYFGGEYYCADGYDVVGAQSRGLSLDDHNNQREEMLLEVTGMPCVLLRRQTSGILSNNYHIHKENTAYRGLDNYGTEFVQGYSQVFNPRRSDGRILVRFGPTKEDIDRTEAGLENTFQVSCWTLVYPALQDGDVIIRYDKYGNENWRYEIIDIERNDTALLSTGAQKFTAVRVRKTDPIYQIPVTPDTSTIPATLTTSISQTNGIPPHTHKISLSTDKSSVAQINQITQIAFGHSHNVVNGVIQESMGHTHTIVV
jgi:hypothetical protein